jgi:hypothetical protein
MAVFHFIMVIFFLLKWLRNFVINDDIAIWSVIMFIIIIIVIILCRVKIFEWSNFCDNRIIEIALNARNTNTSRPNGFSSINLLSI